MQCRLANSIFTMPRERWRRLLAVSVFETLNFHAVEAKHLRSGQAAAVSVDGSAVGTIGRLNEEISANYKFRQPVYVAEIDLQAVLSAETRADRLPASAKFPSIVRRHIVPGERA